jgi:hypothetical protein
VNALVPVMAAGATFAGVTLCGLLAGVWIAHATGQGLWAGAGFATGLITGGYSAYRLVLRSM